MYELKRSKYIEHSYIKYATASSLFSRCIVRVYDLLDRHVLSLTAVV